jgi:hypothetical protein
MENNIYFKKYLKYKTKYLNKLKQSTGGSGDDECLNIIKQFKDTLKQLLLKDDSSLDKTLLDNHLDDWFNKGIYYKDSPLMKLLDSNNPSLTRPLWWSGFNVRDQTIKEKFDNFKKTKSFYSDSDSKLNSDATHHTNMLEHCKTDDGNKRIELINFEKISSTYFTINGLEKLKPPNTDKTTPPVLQLALLLNKGTNIDDSSRFQLSYFYVTELEIIVEYCIKNNYKCNIYIYNLQEYCGRIKELLRDRVNEIIRDKKLENTPEHFRFICFKYSDIQKLS